VNRSGFAALFLLAGCTGEIESANLVGLPITEQVAQQAWVEKALPILGTKCVMCHDGSMPNIGYIAGEDDLGRRETLVSYVPRVVNLLAPTSSRIVTKGAHTGPALDTGTETDAIVIWIKAEAKARPSDTPALRTAMAAAMLCTDPSMVGMPVCPINMVDLTPLGAAGTLEFVLQPVGSDSYFTNLKVKAGAEGLYLEHPLFESYVGGAEPPEPDPIDRYFATTINLMPNTEILLGGNGIATIAGFNANDPLSFQFDVVEKYRPGM
jgi:hypothetical protein